MVNKVYKYLMSGVAPRLRIRIKIMSFFERRGFYLLAQLISNRIQVLYAVYISPKATISDTVRFKHPVGIVIGEGVKIGCRVTIYQNVTLGGARVGDSLKNNYPEIGDDSVIFAGATVIGKVKIGRGCTIGANAVVLQDIPDYATAVGVPAKIIGNNISKQVSNE